MANMPMADPHVPIQAEYCFVVPSCISVAGFTAVSPKKKPRGLPVSGLSVRFVSLVRPP